MKELQELIKKAGFELANLKEIFIIEEMTPYFSQDKLLQKFRLRLQEKADWKKQVLEAIDKVSNMDIDYKSGMTFSNTLKKELGLGDKEE